MYSEIKQNVFTFHTITVEFMHMCVSECIYVQTQAGFDTRTHTHLHKHIRKLKYAYM